MANARNPPALLMLGRAITAACPRCGSRGLFLNWFRLRERCPRCALPLERGEQRDYWLGGMMFNIGLSELLAVVTVGLAIWASYPAIPWDAIWFGAIALMIAAPFLLFPISRIVWLAFDMIFRPHHESHYR
jgi:uncharacterized protein (DUF983 family)